MKLSDVRIAALKPPPPGKRLDVRDDVVPGLVLRVASSGVRTFTVYRRLKGGNPVRITLGRWPDLSIERARKLARVEINDLASGIDARLARLGAKARAATLRQILEEYLALHARRHKHAYQRDLRRMVDAELRPLADKAVTQIDSADVVEWHRRFSSRAVADKAGRSLKAILRYASNHHDLRGPDGKVASDALSTLRLMGKPVRKKTIVRDMSAWHAAVEDLPREAVRDLLMALALTGLRRSEWREARWQQVDLQRGVLRLPDPKSRIDTEIPLSSQVLEILVRRHEAVRGPFANPPGKAAVFSIDGMRPLGTKTLHRAVAETWKTIQHWQLHDLRRGFSTLADIIVGETVSRRLVGHASRANDAHAGYFSAEVATLRPFADRVAAAIFRPATEVVPLASRAAQG